MLRRTGATETSHQPGIRGRIEGVNGSADRSGSEDRSNERRGDEAAFSQNFYGRSGNSPQGRLPIFPISKGVRHEDAHRLAIIGLVSGLCTDGMVVRTGGRPAQTGRGIPTRTCSTNGRFEDRHGRLEPPLGPRALQPGIRRSIVPSRTRGRRRCGSSTEARRTGAWRTVPAARRIPRGSLRILGLDFAERARAAPASRSSFATAPRQVIEWTYADRSTSSSPTAWRPLTISFPDPPERPIDDTPGRSGDGPAVLLVDDLILSRRHHPGGTHAGKLPASARALPRSAQGHLPYHGWYFQGCRQPDRADMVTEACGRFAPGQGRPREHGSDRGRSGRPANRARIHRPDSAARDRAAGDRSSRSPARASSAIRWPFLIPSSPGKGPSWSCPSTKG